MIAQTDQQSLMQLQSMQYGLEDKRSVGALESFYAHLRPMQPPPHRP